MKRSMNPAWGVGVILVLLAGISLAPRLWGAKEVVPWRTDFAAARTEAAQHHKPVLAYFTAGWCGYCQQMARTTWADPRVAAALGNYVPVKIDADAHHDLDARYRIEALPSYVVLDDAGEVVKFGSGYMRPEQFVEWLATPSVPQGPRDGRG